MSLSDEVYKEMKRLYEGGMTQEQVAAHCHVRHSQAQKILSGARSTSGLELGTFDKMFPNATINLYGDKNITQTASNISVKNGSVNTISMNSGAEQTTESFRVRAIKAIIDLDIPPESMKIVLKTLKELKG